MLVENLPLRADLLLQTDRQSEASWFLTLKLAQQDQDLASVSQIGGGGVKSRWCNMILALAAYI